MGFFGFSEREGYGAQPYDGIAEADGESLGQVPVVSQPQLPALMDIFKQLISSPTFWLLLIGIVGLFYFSKKKS